MATKVGYSETFPTGETWQKIWVEKSIPDEATENDIRNSWYESKKQVRNFFYESNKAAEKQASQEKEIQVGDTLSLIKTAPDIIVLESLKLLARKTPELTEAYRKRLLELKPETNNQNNSY